MKLWHSFGSVLAKKKCAIFGPHTIIFGSCLVDLWHCFGSVLAKEMWAISGPANTNLSGPQLSCLSGPHLCQRKFADWAGCKGFGRFNKMLKPTPFCMCASSCNHISLIYLEMLRCLATGVIFYTYYSHH